MDWDHVKSADLYKLFEGFLPRSGVLKSVTVYPSDFGLERMAEEAVSGPPAEIFNQIKSDALTSVQVGSEGDQFNEDMLRKYQLDRLKYYYAVAECDSISTAKQVYEACDGAEFEVSRSGGVFKKNYDILVAIYLKPFNY
jgi:hypothetical protein